MYLILSQVVKKIRYLKISAFLLTIVLSMGVLQAAEKLIVATFYPIYITTLNITKDVPNVKVVNMTPNTAGCLHDYQLTPADLRLLTKASVVVMNGAGMESFIDKVVNSSSKRPIISASDKCKLLYEKDSVPNAHVWLSFDGASCQIKAISEGLASFDPQNANLYRKNAQDYQSKIDTLNQFMHASLKPYKNSKIITFHEAFPYFAQEFDLIIAGVVEREPGSEPNAKEIAETIKLVRSQKVKALFAEPQYPKRSAEIVARESGVPLYSLDPVTTGPSDADAYLKIMKENSQVLRKALQ